METTDSGAASPVAKGTSRPWFRVQEGTLIVALARAEAEVRDMEMEVQSAERGRDALVREMASAQGRVDRLKDKLAHRRTHAADLAAALNAYPRPE